MAVICVDFSLNIDGSLLNEDNKCFLKTLLLAKITKKSHEG